MTHLMAIYINIYIYIYILVAKVAKDLLVGKPGFSKITWPAAVGRLFLIKFKQRDVRRT